MDGLAILLCGAAVAYALARWLDLPAIPLLLLIGVAITALGLLPTELLTDALVLGATFLLFATGIELNPRRVRAQRNIAIRVGAVHFVILGALGFAASRVLGFDLLSSVYLALALTASSTVVVVRLLQRRGQLFEPYARLVVGVLLLQDLLVLLLVPVITEMPAGPRAVLTGVAATVGLMALAYVFHRWLSRFLLHFDDAESVLLLVLATLFIFVTLADVLRLPVVTGAFLGGVALARFPVSATARSQLTSIADFFSTLFYIALGALIALPTLHELFQALGLAALVIVLTSPIVVIVAERAGFSGRPAIEAGLVLSQTSELSLVVGLYGLIAGQLDAGVFKVIALVTLITMMLTPFLATERVAWWLMRMHPLRVRVTARIPSDGHVLLLGSGTTGMPLLETLLASGYEVVVVDDDPVVIERLREAEVPCIRGDATDLEVLREASADRARIICSTIRRVSDNRRLLEFAHGVPVLVRVFDDRDAGWIRALGGTPVVYSHAAAEELLKWLDARYSVPLSPAPRHQ